MTSCELDCRNMKCHNMGDWKNQVRAQLQQRDFKEKHPHVGVFTSLSQLEERFEIRQQIWEDIQFKSLEQEDGKEIKLLQLQLRESEHLAHKLSQTVSDLTTIMYLKEAELQYLQSRVSQFHQEALTLARENKMSKATLCDLEFTTECQSKELAALHLDQNRLKEALERAHTDQEQLLQRWIEEKKMEADRLNKYNDKQERWQHVAKHLKKHLWRETRKEFVPAGTSSTNGANETSSSVIQRFNKTKDTQTSTAAQLQQTSFIHLGS